MKTSSVKYGLKMRVKIIIVFFIILQFGGICFAQHKKKYASPPNVGYSKEPLSFYQTLLQTWCDGMLAQQVNGGSDDGGLFSPSHQFVNGRCGDAVYPFLTMYHITGNIKYKTAAIKVFQWSEANVSQPDGSWTNT